MRQQAFTSILKQIQNLQCTYMQEIKHTAMYRPKQWSNISAVTRYRMFCCHWKLELTLLQGCLQYAPHVRAITHVPESLLSLMLTD